MDDNIRAGSEASKVRLLRSFECQLAKLRSFEVRMPKVKLRSFKELPHGKHVAQNAARNFYVFSHIFVEIANQKQIFITQPFGGMAMPSVACIVKTLPVFCHRPR